MTESSKPGDLETVLLKNDSGQLEPVAVPKDVNAEDFQKICNIAFWLQVMNRQTPTVETISAHPELPKTSVKSSKHLRRIMGSAAYKRAALIMGFSVPVDIPKLTEEQELAILVLTDPSFRGGFAARLKLAGIGMATYRGWLAQPLFKETMEELGSRLLKDHETDLMTTLVGLGIEGDINAIRFGFEVSGRHSPAQQSIIDVQLVLEKVVEIIASEIKDEATLARIGTRIIGITPGAVERITSHEVDTIIHDSEMETANADEHPEITAN